MKKVTPYFTMRRFMKNVKSKHLRLLVKHDRCGGTGTDSTVTNNTVQVPKTTGTVTDNGSVYIGLLGGISRYIYRKGEL